VSEIPLIQLIADYGVEDPAFGEVIQKLTLLHRSARVIRTSVPAFSTIATGFWTAQYALVNPVPGMVIYTNTAPRKDIAVERVENEGERLDYAVLDNGTKIVGVNAGYCFSFVKPHIKEFYRVNVSNKGSQFRSRDFFPEAVIGLGLDETKYLGEKLDPSMIPDVPAHRIAWIDGYGNMKTTLRQSEVKFEVGKPILVTLGSMKRTAYYSDGSFSVREGELAFSPGSSGGQDRYMELFLRGLSAWKEMGKPNIEDDFSVEQFAI
jgi:S-adenosylmethionine hydrolase